MVKYNVNVLRPGVTTGVSGLARKYEESVLQESLDSLEGVPVNCGSSQTSSDDVIGEVLDAEYDGDHVTCTVEISDDEMAARIDEGLMTIAPAMVLESDNNEDPEPVTSMEFRNLFLSPEASDLVGKTEREE